MFSVKGNGFHLHFKNGNTMSVRFNQYREGYYYAEISAWKPDGEIIQVGSGSGEVISWVDSNEFLDLMKRIGQ